MRSRALRACGWVIVALAAAYGCGGDDATTIIGDDGGKDGATDSNSATDGAGDDGTTKDSGGKDGAGDAQKDGADGATACSPNGSACPVAADGGTLHGLCVSSTCAPCNDPADDSACAKAYGDGGGWICHAGDCEQGNCHDDSGCTPGQICGVKTPNFCGPCTSDADCKKDSDYAGKGYTLCNVSAGTCVQPACTGADGTTCPQNQADVCCSQTCYTGNCCTNAQCDADGGGTTPACVQHNCTACDPVGSNTYFVDPVNGSDASASNGSGLASGQATSVCAFKTLTHAVAVVTAANPPAGTKIVILSNINGVTMGYGATAETFPFVVPVNTEITTQGGPVTIDVPPTVPTGDGGTQPGFGFVLANAGSQVDTMTIDGLSNGSSHAIVARGNNTATTIGPSLVAQRFTGYAGIRVEGNANLTIKGGTQSIHNARGLRVVDSAKVTINNTATPAVDFDFNTEAGIRVDATAQLTLTGAPGTGGAGTVTTNNNNKAGLWVDQDATNGVPPQNVVTGLVAWNNINNGTGNGAYFVGGSNVKIRSSQFLANGVGVFIDSASTSSNWQYDTSHIDVGTSTLDPGLNSVQGLAALDGGPSAANLLVGVCYNILPNKSQTLYAAGNTWVNGTQLVDCSKSSSSSVTLLGSGNCAGGLDLGGQGLATNNVVVAYCGH